jgi:hypothetical protein
MGSKKRKYYVVRRGHTPGIYTDWGATQEQVSGFPGAEYKSFSSLQEAEAFAAGIPSAAASAAGPPPPPAGPAAPAAAAPRQQAPPSTAGPSGAGGGGRLPAGVTDLGSRGGGLKYYGIKRGRQTGVFFGSWPDAQKLVSGYPGALFKGFPTAGEAFEWYGPATAAAPASAAAAAAAAAGLPPLTEEQRAAVTAAVAARPRGQQQLKRQRPRSDPTEEEEAEDDEADDGDLMVTVVSWQLWVVGSRLVAVGVSTHSPSTTLIPSSVFRRRVPRQPRTRRLRLRGRQQADARAGERAADGLLAERSGRSSSCIC